MSDMATHRFSIADPLPDRRITLIEASAGTGKTYALSALAVRYVAEADIPIGRILLVTFTRAATAELRERVRRRLVEAAEHLESVLAGPEAEPSADPLFAVLGQCALEERGARLDRLRTAVREFDTANISTIHGFCSLVRSSMGVLSGDNIDAVPSESESELISQVCADLLFRELSTRGDDTLADQKLSDLATLVRKARTLSDADVRAESGADRDLLRAELVREATSEIDSRLRRTGGLSYDSLMSSVRDAIDKEPQLIRQLRSQYEVALIDEFQDTDSVQWDIFSKVFGDPADPSRLVLVGDPKQAIYSFRGGDVYTYLRAKHEAEVKVLGTNQRSDAAVVEAMNAIGAGHTFGEAEIAYEVVDPAPRHAGRRLVSADGATAPGLVVRCLLDADVAGIKDLKSDTVRRGIAVDLADVVVDLLATGTVERPGKPTRPVTPDMIAVLVGSTFEAAPIAKQLRARNVPAVLRLKDDVAGSEAFDQWRTLLWALDRPAARDRATAAALTWFFGWSPSKISASIAAIERGDESSSGSSLAALQIQLVEWSELLADKGMAALLGAARREQELMERLLADPNGERNLTDLEHLAELVHADVKGGRGGLSASTALRLLDGLGGGGDEVAAESAQRRVESDAAAVQIMTIHGAKGLEFPIVLLPGLWSGGKRVQAESPYSYYDAQAERRVLDVSSSEELPKKSATSAGAIAKAEAKRQNCGDQHRMTYVALTRAVHQTIVWWAKVGSAGRDVSGLGRLIVGAPDGLGAHESTFSSKNEPSVDELRERFIERGGGDTIRVEAVTPSTGAKHRGPVAADQNDGGESTESAVAELGVAVLGRDLQRSSRFWSFSSMSKFIRSDGATSTSTAGDVADESGGDSGADDEVLERLPADADVTSAADAATSPTSLVALRGSSGWSVLSPYEGLGAGKDFGNLVHDTFEHTDFGAPDLSVAISNVLAQRGGSSVTEEQHARLPEVLAAVVRTPLGAPFGGIRLADLAVADRLNELNFHLPISPDAPVSARRIGEVIQEHLPPGDLLLPWAERLASGLSGLDLQGYLNGSIDLTLRYRIDGIERYSVVDYKTNNLAPTGEPGWLYHYGPEGMARTMAHSHYALQAIIYSVALHRYLRWRLDGYDPHVHLGPAGYLFVRGMVGTDTPIVAEGPHAGTPAGVFTWHLTPTLIEAVSALFAGDGIASPTPAAASVSGGLR